MECINCKYRTTMNGYSTDGFDYMIDWICTKNNQVIRGAVEWHEEKKIETPDWCPISLITIRNNKIDNIIDLPSS